MLTSRFLAQVAVPFVLALTANAETHVIKFVNNCGSGSPALIYDGKNILTGDTYTSNGPWSGIAYLQQGYCNTNGENCTLLETTLINPTCAGCGSSTDISLIQPHAYSVETSFAYYNGCDGHGKTCSSPDCASSAFFAPNDNFVQVACQSNNVNLLVAFCADASQLMTGNSTMPSGTPSTPASVPPPTGPPMPSGTPSKPASVPPPTGTSMPTGSDDAYCDDEPEPSSTPTPPVNPAGSDDSGCDDEPTATPSSTPTLPANAGSFDNSECGDEPATTPSSTPTLPANPAGSDDSDCGDEPATPSSTPTPAVNLTNTNMPDPGCDEPGQTTPTQMPTNGSVPERSGDPGQTNPPSMTPTMTQTPPMPPPPASPTVSRRRCRPRPTGMSVSPSAPTSPAYTPPPPPASMPSVTPLTPPAGMPSAGGSNPDPCDEGGDTSMPSMPRPSPLPVRRRHHRRSNPRSY